MLNIINVKEHTNCVRCGECCGVNRFSSKECVRILSYVKENSYENLDYVKEVINQKKSVLTCKFLDTDTNNCSIYSARPFVCRIFGVDKLLQCPNGNTHNFFYGNYAKEELKAHRSMFLTNKLIKEIKNMNIDGGC